MATLRQIVGKALEVKSALDTASLLQIQRDQDAGALATLESRLTAANTTLNTLTAELRALVNEP